MALTSFGLGIQSLANFSRRSKSTFTQCGSHAIKYKLFEDLPSRDTMGDIINNNNSKNIQKKTHNYNHLSSIHSIPTFHKIQNACHYHHHLHRWPR